MAGVLEWQEFAGRIVDDEHRHDESAGAGHRWVDGRRDTISTRHVGEHDAPIARQARARLRSQRAVWMRCPKRSRIAVLRRVSPRGVDSPAKGTRLRLEVRCMGLIRMTWQPAPWLSASCKQQRDTAILAAVARPLGSKCPASDITAATHDRRLNRPAAAAPPRRRDRACANGRGPWIEPRPRGCGEPGRQGLQGQRRVPAVLRDSQLHGDHTSVEMSTAEMSTRLGTVIA